eukprot:TRINITY_DN1515_c0_g1_i2.p1 TRINITY_DN1515_c0_g1~~TRINITY_DN1515_c0_g1_i2.p1  ORF type:complete len:115 (+),score=13.28 TRINITY_DN1515_c0_g1_i2:66-410(+)
MCIRDRFISMWMLFPYIYQLLELILWINPKDLIVSLFSALYLSLTLTLLLIALAWLCTKPCVSAIIVIGCIASYFFTLMFVYRHMNLSLIHISEPTRLLSISYAVFCLKKKRAH